MSISRGDVVKVAASGDFGKPRPAVVVQSDAFPQEHASVIVCQMTSTLAARGESPRCIRAAIHPA